jgi:hypothetical protein
LEIGSHGGGGFSINVDTNAFTGENYFVDRDVEGGTQVFNDGAGRWATCSEMDAVWRAGGRCEQYWVYQ